MKKIFYIFFFFITMATILSPIEVFAQKETFDLTAYTAPKNWGKEINENVITYSFTDRKKKTWCQVGIYKSTIRKGSIEQDFDSEWEELIKGESVTKGFEDWILAATTSSTGENNTRFSFTMNISGASADLKRAMASGELLMTGQVNVMNTSQLQYRCAKTCIYY